MKKLYRLKSNLKTVVEYDGKWTRIYWSESMLSSGYDTRWIMSHNMPESNMIPLSEDETKEVNRLVKEFEARKKHDAKYYSRHRTR